MSATHGMIWWSELMTRAPQAACEYYATVAGWAYTTMPMPEGDYIVAHVGDRSVAGIMDMTGMPGMDSMVPHWFTYVAVDDVDAAVDQTRAAGGQILRPPFDVDGVGRIAIITDPTGAALGIMTPAPMEEASPADAPAA